MSKDDEDNSVQEEEISLCISELPPEYQCGDSLSVDMVDKDFKAETEVDCCLPRFQSTLKAFT